MFGANTGFNKFIADVQRMRDVDGKANRLAALAVLVPVRDDIADQIVAVHTLGKLRFDVIADAGFDATKIDITRRIYARPDQEFLFDQFGDLRRLDNAVEEVAKP